MKIRIKGNAIRLRLTRTEVATFVEAGTLVESTTFAPGQTLTYTLQSSPQSRSVSARHQDGAVIVYVPRAEALRWAQGDDVGLSGEQSIGAGEWLSILIEKDFRCLHGDGVPDSDAYPHPAEV